MPLYIKVHLERDGFLEDKSVRDTLLVLLINNIIRLNHLLENQINQSNTVVNYRSSLDVLMRITLNHSSSTITQCGRRKLH